MRDYKVGDEVYSRPRDLRIGAFAEYIAIDQADIALKPQTLEVHDLLGVGQGRRMASHHVADYRRGTGRLHVVGDEDVKPRYLPDRAV